MCVNYCCMLLIISTFGIRAMVSKAAFAFAFADFLNCNCARGREGISVKERAIREKICTPDEEFDLCAYMRRPAQA